MKQCCTCKQNLPEEKFSIGHRWECIKCETLRSARWRKDNPYKYLLNKLRATERTRGNANPLSVTAEEIEALVKASDLCEEDPRKIKIARKDEKEPWTLENSCVRHTVCPKFKSCMGRAKTRQVSDIPGENLFWCSVCQQHLSIESFWKSRLRDRRTICIQCSQLRKSLWTKHNQYSRMVNYLRSSERKRGVVGDIYADPDDIERIVKASEYSDKDPAELSLARKDQSIPWNLENCIVVPKRPRRKRSASTDEHGQPRRKIE